MQNSAASISAAFSVDEVVSLFGIVGLTGDIPATLPLTTSLGGVTVTIVDSGGISRLAPLYGAFASAGQINALIPADTAPGVAAVTIMLPDKSTVMTAIRIAGSGPGVFTANMTGQDTFAGQVLYVHSDGTQTVTGSTTFDTSSNTNVPVPINLGTPGDQVFLVLYATGLRHANAVTATLNNISIPVVYFGAQGTYQGLDQVNLGPLPTSLAGAGSVNLVISTDGQAANSVIAVIK